MHSRMMRTPRGAQVRAEVGKMQPCPAQGPASHQLDLQPALLLRPTAGYLELVQGWMLQLPLPKTFPVDQSPTKEDRVNHGDRMAEGLHASMMHS